ncbi:MAG: hypothetical protein KVP17_004890 [Porospora cf. gigantea B]|uniref:uncharacterized protein n=1 Tax=Porospora cf. gigantea B TaxID=2853592 RepID=UPI003571A4F8|nr:MAG: hypothetical protein KVP17_004890 [Porospora cf. gigantea B]
MDYKNREILQELTIQQARRIFGTHKCQADILRELLAIPLPPGATMGDAYQNRRAATKARASRSRRNFNISLQKWERLLNIKNSWTLFHFVAASRPLFTNEEDRKIFWDRPEVIKGTHALRSSASLLRKPAVQALLTIIDDCHSPNVGTHEHLNTDL